MGYALEDSRLLPIPFELQDQLMGIAGFSSCWVFAQPTYQPSVWMVLKREGFSGDWLFTSDELWQFKNDVGLGGIAAVLSFLRARPITARNPFALWAAFEEAVLTQGVQVYQFQDSDLYRLADPHDRYYSHQHAYQSLSSSPEDVSRHKLASILGQEILARWREKTTADQAHFSLPWYEREFIELSDIGSAVVDPAWNALVGLKDTVVFVCQFAYDAASNAIISATVSMKQAAKFQIALTTSIIEALQGDSLALKKQLSDLGISIQAFGHSQLQNAQNLQRVAQNISDQIMQHLKEGMRLLNLILADARTRNMLRDYIDSLFESKSYRDSRVAGVKAVSTAVFEFGPDIAIGMATGGAGALAARAAKTASRTDKISKIRYGPFSPQGMDALADLAKVIDGEQSIGKALPPQKGVDVPDYAATKPKPETKPAPARKPIPIMKRHDVPCFKAGDKIPTSKYPEYDRQLTAQQNGLNEMTVQEYLDGRKSYQAMGRGDGKAQAEARIKYEIRRKKEFEEELEDEGIIGDEAVTIITKKIKAEMSTLDALHNPDMIAGGKDVVNELGDRSVNRSIGSQWRKPKGTSRVEEMDMAANQALKTQGPDAKMNVDMHRCK